MADPAYTAARVCVECGTNFECRSQRGRPRQRCYDCSKAPHRSEASKDRAKLRAREYRRQNGDELRAKGRDRQLRKRRERGGLSRDQWVALRYPDPVSKRDHTCTGCGATFRPKRTDRTKYCSRACAYRNASEWVKTPRAAGPTGPRTRWPRSRVWCSQCAHCERPFVSKRFTTWCQAHRAKEDRRQTKPPVSGECTECGMDFVRPDAGRLSTKFCSAECGRKHAKRIDRTARKARQRSVTVESVNPMLVFRRDRWTCQLCHTKTPKHLRGSYEPNAPELDHIIPLSRGGEHSYRNTQCLCRGCNGDKGDSVRGQLRLFG